MAAVSVSSIRPLPADVLSQIRSSVIIASLNDAVLNLIKNSLDSNAHRVDVQVDYSRGSCSVEDNGLGIEPVEFSEDGGLGKMHHTSKYSSQPAENYGRRGSFIALLSALSLVAITSHHHKHRYHNTISMHRSKVIARQIPSPAQHRISDRDHGTRVTVRDLFGNMPVRVRQRPSEPAANEKEWQGLRRGVVALLLAWPYDVSITLRNVASGQNIKIRSHPDAKETLVAHLCSILSQAMYITPSDKEFWISTTASTSNLVITGTISTEPCAHKNFQFLSFNIFPMADGNGGNLLYDHINRLFAKSSFGNQEEDETLNDLQRYKRSTDARYKKDGYTSRELKGSKKGADRWPMFCLKIESGDAASSLGEGVTDEFLDAKSGHLNSVIDLLTAMCLGFLKEHHFRVKPGGQTGRRVRNKDPQSTRSLQVENARKEDSTDKAALSRGKHSLTNFGTDIKLPSFSRGLLSSAESPFVAWTRVKRGQIRKVQNEADMTSTSNTGGVSMERSPVTFTKPMISPTPGKVARETTADQLSSPRMKFFSDSEYYGSKAFATENLRTQLPKANTVSNTSLIGLDGRVVQPPFSLLSHSPSESSLGTEPSAVSTESPIPFCDTTGPLDDDLISWTNPISKEKSLVCRRTGLVIPSHSVRLMPEHASEARVSTYKARPILRAVSRGEEPSNWITGLLKSWENPVFQPAELPIPQSSFDGLDVESQKILHGRHHNCTHIDIDKAFRSSGGPTGRLTKDALRRAEIVSQVDRKFILIKISTAKDQNNIEESDLDLLVLVDQHAADERCRIEDLFNELCTNKVLTTLETPLIFDVSYQELQLFQKEFNHFRDWGISYEVTEGPENTRMRPQVTVKGLPSVIAERCRIDPTMLTKLMRTEVWKIHRKSKDSAASQGVYAGEATNDWLSKLRECPQGILDILNSRSCRSAIMFNDELSAEQCKSLIARLARCSFPFQCAHGRPSMIPLVDLSTVF